MPQARPMLVAIDHLAWLVECAALTYTGELKTELARMCDAIRAGDDGYNAPAVRASLPELDAALEAYRASDYLDGASRLSRISRAWWEALWIGERAAPR
ncbi:hypothetical protein [Lysobacter sp. HA35]